MLRRVRREERAAGLAERGLSERGSSGAFSVIASVGIDGTIYERRAGRRTPVGSKEISRALRSDWLDWTFSTMDRIGGWSRS